MWIEPKLIQISPDCRIRNQFEIHLLRKFSCNRSPGSHKYQNKISSIIGMGRIILSSLDKLNQLSFETGNVLLVNTKSMLNWDMGKYLSKKLLQSERCPHNNMKGTSKYNNIYHFLLLSALGNLGNVLTQKGRLTEAENAFKKALEFRPNMADTHYNL